MLDFQMDCTDYWFTAFYKVFVPLYMYFADVSLNEPKDETNCCDFSVYSVVV